MLKNTIYKQLFVQLKNFQIYIKYSVRTNGWRWPSFQTHHLRYKRKKKLKLIKKKSYMEPNELLWSCYYYVQAQFFSLDLNKDVPLEHLSNYLDITTNSAGQRSWRKGLRNRPRKPSQEWMGLWLGLLKMLFNENGDANKKGQNLG